VQRTLIEGQMLPAPLSRDYPNCPVERASNAVLDHAHKLAEVELEKAYATTTLAQIAETAVAMK
jgi:hypothetical protein